MHYYPWQQQQFNLLHSAFLQKRLSHAYLLSGVAGLGKLDFAKTFSEFLLCEQTTAQLLSTQPVEVGLLATTQSCGICKSCKQFLANTHPDFLFIQPEEKSKIIKIDQIRFLSEKISHTAHAGGYQIVIISPADAMPAQAANALLKTVEEPHGNVIIFLIDHQEHALLPTIVSRCQKIVFSANEKNALPWLQKEIPAEKNSETLLRLSCFSPLKAKLLSQHNYLSLRDQILNHLAHIILHHTNPIAPIAQWLKNDINLIIDILTFIFIDISRLQCNVNKHFIFNQDRVETIKEIAEKINALQLQKCMDYLNEKKLFLSKGINLNMQLCLESVFININKM